MTTTSNAAAIVSGIAVAFVIQLGLSVIGASTLAAAPAPTKVAQTSTADASSAEVEPAVADATSDDLSNCSRARRRLWVDGEGWIVRRITTCP